MAFGPYASDWEGSSAIATFDLMIDNHDANSELTLTLDVYDATSGVSLAVMNVYRDDFTSSFTYQSFSLPMTLEGLDGHAMETRVYWHANAFVKLDKVTVWVSEL